MDRMTLSFAGWNDGKAEALSFAASAACSNTHAKTAKYR
jgi:hypothetical protein